MDRHENGVIELACMHDFGAGCLVKWLDAGKDSCPNCRQPIAAAIQAKVYRMHILTALERDLIIYDAMSE